MRAARGRASVATELLPGDNHLINGYSLRDYGWDLALIGERGKPEVRQLMRTCRRDLTGRADHDAECWTASEAE